MVRYAGYAGFDTSIFSVAQKGDRPGADLLERCNMPGTVDPVGVPPADLDPADPEPVVASRTIGRAVGALFLLAFGFYIGGNALVASASNAADILTGVSERERRIATGALLMLLDCAAVVAIGVLVHPVLRRRHPIAAHGYLAARLAEAVMLAMGILGLLLLIPLGQAYDDGRADPGLLTVLAELARAADAYAYQFAMISLALGSLVFCRVLFLERLTPRPLAIWGFLGYVIFLTGAVLEVLGYRVGLLLSIPGGLFEVAFGVWLLIRGFAPPLPMKRPMHATQARLTHRGPGSTTPRPVADPPKEEVPM